MRSVVLALALLATLKIWVQDSLYRAATSEALIAAYRIRANEACARTALSRIASGGPATDWSKAGEPRVAVGNPAIAVHIWQFDHDLWNARFRQPYLVVPADASGAACTYDILADTAEIARP